MAAAEVNFASGRARVVLDRDTVDSADLQRVVEKLGYGLNPIEVEEKPAEEDPEGRERRQWGMRAWVAIPLAVPLIWLAMFSGDLGEEPWARWTQMALATPVQFWVGWPFLAGMGRVDTHRRVDTGGEDCR